MKINSKMVLITIIFGAIFIFVPMGKIPVTYYEYECCGLTLGMPIAAATHSGHLRLYGFPFQWTPKILPHDAYSDYKRVESLNHKSNILLDGIVGVAVGGVVGYILFRERKR